MADSTIMVSDGSSVGDAVSSRGEDELIEDEDLYYIPERRPSLDLGPTPMDTSQWYAEVFLTYKSLFLLQVQLLVSKRCISLLE